MCINQQKENLESKYEGENYEVFFLSNKNNFKTDIKYFGLEFI